MSRTSYLVIMRLSMNCVTMCAVLLTVSTSARETAHRRNAMVRDDNRQVEDNKEVEDKFRVNQMWHWYQLSRNKINALLLDHEDCKFKENRKVTDLEQNLKFMGDKLTQLELAMDALTRSQTREVNSPIPQPLVATTTPPPPPRLPTTTTTTIPTQPPTTTTSSPSYPKINCPGKGFYQVGLSCYSFTFYRSDTFAGAQQYCKISGGYLAVLNTNQEMVSIMNHLNQHVTPSIYPWELVSFFVGGKVKSGSWEWAEGGGRGEVDAGIEGCQDNMVGDCLALAWDEERGCQFSLSDMDCRTRNRFICEADPLEGEGPAEPWAKPVHSPLQLPDEYTVQMPY